MWTLLSDCGYSSLKKHLASGEWHTALMAWSILRSHGDVADSYSEIWTVENPSRAVLGQKTKEAVLLLAQELSDILFPAASLHPSLSH
jgi:hypothetical protein